jgi:hypothetical protein
MENAIHGKNFNIDVISSFIHAFTLKQISYYIWKVPSTH